MTNYADLLDTPSINYWIWLYDLVHRLGMHSFRPTWPCSIIDVLATRVKCIEPPHYCAMIKTNVSVFLPSVINQFEYPKRKFFALTRLFVYLCSFQITHGEKTNKQTMHDIFSALILTTTAYTYQSLQCFRHVICIPKYCKTFDPPLWFICFVSKPYENIW